MKNISLKSFWIHKYKPKCERICSNVILFFSVKKDAHAMILEFIRSRPPLKKVSWFFTCGIYLISVPYKTDVETVNQFLIKWFNLAANHTTAVQVGKVHLLFICPFTHRCFIWGVVAEDSQRTLKRQEKRSVWFRTKLLGAYCQVANLYYSEKRREIPL